MNKYKVEFIEKTFYVVDVLAKNQEEAEKLAREKLDEIKNQGVLHNYETSDPYIVLNQVYDVTNTDDPFNP